MPQMVIFLSFQGLVDFGSWDLRVCRLPALARSERFDSSPIQVHRKAESEKKNAEGRHNYVTGEYAKLEGICLASEENPALTRRVAGFIDRIP